MVSKLFELLLLDYQSLLLTVHVTHKHSPNYDKDVLTQKYAVYRERLLDIISELDLGARAEWEHLTLILPRLEL